MGNLVAFGSWRCNCTMLADTLEEIPAACPMHAAGLLGPRSLEENSNNVALGITAAAGRTST